jgi:hypothetical protein
MTGGRTREKDTVCPRSDTARRHGASVETETHSPSEAYASFPHLRPERPATWNGLPWAWRPRLWAAAKIRFVGWVWIALLACAVAVLVAAEWPRLSERFGFEGRRQRERKRRKSNLRVLRPEDDDFAASVERDLAQLPTIKERDRNN